MRTDLALHRLNVHQQTILDHMSRAAALLGLPSHEAHAPLAHGRWTMVRLLQEYQAFKQAEIFNPAIRYGAPAQVDCARRLKAECIATADAFRAHVRDWSSTDVAERWEDYRPAMRTMAERLRCHLLTERQAVIELLAGSERTRRLAG